MNGGGLMADDSTVVLARSTARESGPREPGRSATSATRLSANPRMAAGNLVAMTEDSSGPLPLDSAAAEPDVLLEIEASIAHLFRAARKALREYSTELHPELQPTGFSILRIIDQNGPIQAGAIAAISDLDKSAVSRQVKVLRDLGLVDTKPDPLDGRSSFLIVSDYAVERMDYVRTLVQRDYRRRFESWTDRDLRRFASDLGRFNGNPENGDQSDAETAARPTGSRYGAAKPQRKGPSSG